LVLAIFLAHSTATSWRYWASVSSLPSSTSLTPRVLLASDVSNLGIVILSFSLIITWIFPDSSVEVLYFHCWFCHLKSTMYQKHLSSTNLPPVAWRRPCHIVSEFCIFYYVGWFVVPVNHDQICVIKKMQNSLMMWHSLLCTTGGKLVPDKCFWCMVDFKWQNQQWKYKNSTELPGKISHYNQPKWKDYNSQTRNIWSKENSWSKTSARWQQWDRGSISPRSSSGMGQEDGKNQTE